VFTFLLLAAACSVPGVLYFEIRQSVEHWVRMRRPSFTQSSRGPEDEEEQGRMTSTSHVLLLCLTVSVLMVWWSHGGVLKFGYGYDLREYMAVVCLHLASMRCSLLVWFVVNTSCVVLLAL
jgi:hypothetical protein